MLNPWMQDVTNKKKVQGSKLKGKINDQVKKPESPIKRNWVARRYYPPTTEKQFATFKLLTPISCSASGKNVIDKSKQTSTSLLILIIL